MHMNKVTYDNQNQITIHMFWKTHTQTYYAHIHTVNVHTVSGLCVKHLGVIVSLFTFIQRYVGMYYGILKGTPLCT